MGNPAFNFGDGGACRDCQHFHGFRTTPDAEFPLVWVLCDQDTGQPWHKRISDYERGCRFWEPTTGWEKLAEPGQKLPS